MGRETKNKVKFEKGLLLSLAQTRPASGEVVWYDTVQPGLTLRIPAKGEPRFGFYGWINGGPKRRNWEPLREANGVTVPQAREWAKQAWVDLKAGREPGETDGTTPANVLTLGGAYALFIEVQKRTNRTWHENELQWKKYLESHSAMPLSAVTANDAEWLKELHAGISDGTDEEPAHPGAADRLMSMVSKMLRVALKLPAKGPTPASAVVRNGTNTRDRKLSDAEFRRIFAALDTYESEPVIVPGGDGTDPAEWPDYRRPKDPAKLETLRAEWRARLEQRRADAREVRRTAADVLRVAIWSGQRIANVCAMEWTELDLEAGVWTIPASKFKTDKPHTAVLMPEAVELLLRRRSASPKDARHVFPAGNTKSKCGHFSNYHNAWDRVKELAGIKGHHDGTWVHDLRGNFAKRMSAAGANAFVIRDQLGHSKIETTLRYVGSGNLETMKDAVKQTAEKMRASMAKRGSEGVA